MRRAAWISLLAVCVPGVFVCCRVGYETTEPPSGEAGDSAGGVGGEGAGGVSGTSSGNAGTGQGGLPQGGSNGTGGSDMPGGAGGDTGGTDSTGGVAGTGGGKGGTTATGGSTGAGGSATGGTGKGGSGGSATGGTSGAATGGSTAGGGAGGSMGGVSGSAGAGGGGGAAGAPNPTLCTMSTFGGHDYLLCKELRSFWAANDGCIASGMRLIRVDSAQENQWLYDNAYTDPGRNSLVWIGATDQAVEGEWRWTDGALFWLGDEAGMAENGLFAAWYQREPNNVAPGENCGALETAGSVAVWYDKDCSIGQPFACESL